MAEPLIGSESRPLRVAVIGSGPSGFYAAEELLSQQNLKVEVDMFDRLPTPFGLVRGGVAPDHQKIKTVTKVYEKTAGRPGFRFFGNVEFGKDLSTEELKKHYDAAIMALGAKSDRRMNIPGEDLKGSYPATIFVGWYNGHPDYQELDFDLSCERIAVVGNGNVAMDVTRILGSDPEILASTDISEKALNALRKSKVKEIYLLGRRGPAQAAFTNPEIRELCHLKGADLVVDPKEVELDPLTKEALPTLGMTAQKNVEILTDQSKIGPGIQPRKIIVRSLVSPVELIGKNGQVTAMKLEKNQLYKHKDGSLRPKGTGQFETLPVDLVFRSVGYKGVPIPGLPYDNDKGTIPNAGGRIVDPATQQPILGLYVVGWAKRGPTGVIGTNKPDSIETARLLLADLQGKKADDSNVNAATIVETLNKKQIHFVNYQGWQHLDRIEIERGKAAGKIRQKFTEIDEMIAALKNAPER